MPTTKKRGRAEGRGSEMEHRAFDRLSSQSSTPAIRKENSVQRLKQKAMKTRVTEPENNNGQWVYVGWINKWVKIA